MVGAYAVLYRQLALRQGADAQHGLRGRSVQHSVDVMLYLCICHKLTKWFQRKCRDSVDTIAANGKASATLDT